MNYKRFKSEFEIAIQKREEEESYNKEIEKLQGIQSEGRAPKPIISPLFLKTVQAAYVEGVINDVEFCTRLRIKPQEIDKYLQ